MFVLKSTHQKTLDANAALARELSEEIARGKRYDEVNEAQADQLATAYEELSAAKDELAILRGADRDNYSLAADLKAAVERADYWKKVADEERERPKTGDGQNLARLRAQLDMVDDEEEAPIGTVEGLTTRLNEIWGDSLTLEDILARQETYATKHKTQEPAQDG